jgi:hypothetical protein
LVGRHLLDQCLGRHRLLRVGQNLCGRVNAGQLAVFAFAGFEALGLRAALGSFVTKPNSGSFTIVFSMAFALAFADFPDAVFLVALFDISCSSFSTGSKPMGRTNVVAAQDVNLKLRA